MTVCFEGIYKRKESVASAFFCFLLVCFVLLLHFVMVSVLSLWVTQVCVYLQSISGLVIVCIFSEVRLLNQGVRKESFEILEISVLIFI